MSIAEVRQDSLQSLLLSMGFNLQRATEIEGSFYKRLGRSGPSDRKIGDFLSESALQRMLRKSINAAMKRMSDAEIDALAIGAE